MNSLMNSEMMGVGSYRLCPKSHWAEVSAEKVEAQTGFLMAKIYLNVP